MLPGGVSEWSKETVLKTVGPNRASWVRIPLPPRGAARRGWCLPQPEALGFWQAGRARCNGEVAEWSKALAC